MFSQTPEEQIYASHMQIHQTRVGFMTQRIAFSRALTSLLDDEEKSSISHKISKIDLFIKVLLNQYNRLDIMEAKIASGEVLKNAQHISQNISDILTPMDFDKDFLDFSIGYLSYLMSSGNPNGMKLLLDRFKKENSIDNRNPDQHLYATDFTVKDFINFAKINGRSGFNQKFDSYLSTVGARQDFYGLLTQSN